MSDIYDFTPFKQAYFKPLMKHFLKKEPTEHCQMDRGVQRDYPTTPADWKKIGERGWGILKGYVPMDLVRTLQQALFTACGKGNEYWKTLSGGGVDVWGRYQR